MKLRSWIRKFTRGTSKEKDNMKITRRTSKMAENIKFPRRTSKKKDNIRALSFKRIKSRVDCKSYSNFFLVFSKERRKSEEAQRLASVSIPCSDDYVDMTLKKKNTCERSLAAILTKARAEAVEEEFEYEPIYICAEFKHTSCSEQDSSIYEYCDF